MKRNENAILVLLTITTAVLTAMLLWALSTTPEAMAGSASVSGGTNSPGLSTSIRSSKNQTSISRPWSL